MRQTKKCSVLLDYNFILILDHSMCSILLLGGAVNLLNKQKSMPLSNTDGLNVDLDLCNELAEILVKMSKGTGRTFKITNLKKINQGQNKSYLCT